MREEGEGAFEAQASGEVVQRFAGKGAEDAVEVVGREVGDLGDVFERERLGEVACDVVDGAVDAIDVVMIRKIWQVGHGAATVQWAG